MAGRECVLARSLLVELVMGGRGITVNELTPMTRNRLLNALDDVVEELPDSVVVEMAADFEELL